MSCHYMNIIFALIFVLIIFLLALGHVPSSANICYLHLQTTNIVLDHTCLYSSPNKKHLILIVNIYR